MKKVLIILFLLTSCISKYKRVKFTHYSSNTKYQKKIKFILNVPKGFNSITYKSGGEVESEFKYLYPDSSIIYLSDFGISLNEPNIETGGYADKKFKYIRNLADSTSEKLILSGKNKSGLYWKEVLIGKTCVGYLNVKEENISIYDKSLTTFNYR